MRSRVTLAFTLAILATACSSGAPTVGPTSVPTPGAPTPGAATSIPTTAPTPTSVPTPAPVDRVAAPTPAPTADSAGCPMDDDGNFALAVALDRALVIDGRRIDLSTAGIGARNGSWQVDDLIGRFWTLDLDWTPVVVAVDGEVGIRGSPGMELTGGSVGAWGRSELVLGSGGIEISRPARPLASAVTDGRLDIRVPKTMGTWVLELHPMWQTACLRGDGVAYAIVRTK